jgi:hypothetical protein
MSCLQQIINYLIKYLIHINCNNFLRAAANHPCLEDCAYIIRLGRFGCDLKDSTTPIYQN